MKPRNILTATLLTAALIFTGSINANVLNPKLDIQDNGPGDTGISLTATTFGIDATAFTIITNGSPIDIPDLDFVLNSTGSLGVFSGSFSVDGGAGLAGTFSGLTVSPDTTGGMFFGDVSYSGGYLAGPLTGGRIEGVWDSSGMVAKLGPVNTTVIPVPAALWLFASGLIGLAGIARRRHS